IEHYGIECEAVRTGTLHCAVGQRGFADVAERAKQWKQRRAAVELLDARSAAQYIGSNAYSGALLDRRAGTVQPLAYVRGSAQHSVRYVVRIHACSPALGFEVVGTACRVETPRESVRARCVIVASDAYSTGPVLSIQREQVMLPYFNLATRPLDASVRAS